MTGSNHDLLLRLFEKALTLPPAARQTFLDSKCRGDAELEQRLQAMLAAAHGPTTAAPSSLRRAEELAAAATAALREGPGTRIGPYKLLQQIGEGGFGVVFLAEQEQPVARRVALKIAERYLVAFYTAWNAAEPDATRAAKAAEWQTKVDARH